MPDPRPTRNVLIGVAFFGVTACALGVWASTRPEPTRSAHPRTPTARATDDARPDAGIAGTSDAAGYSVVRPALPRSAVVSLVTAGLSEDDVERAVAALHAASSIAVAPVAAACAASPTGEYDVVDA